MRKIHLNQQILFGLVLILLSVFFYALHYAIFRDAHHIFIYLLGDIAFVFIEVLLVTVIIHHLLAEREKRAMLKKLNMVIEVYILLYSTLVIWAYNSGMESSPFQATLGKLALGLYVTDLKGQRISLKRATGRTFAKFLSIVTLLLGYLGAGFTSKKQALHDLVAGCLVLRK